MMTSILIMVLIWGFIIFTNVSSAMEGLDLFIFTLIILIAVIALIQALKTDKDEKAGLPADDELSTRIKYKSGYYAFLVSMYMWLFIFLFNDKFPDNETMLGGGILLSALISFIAKYAVTHKFNE